MKKFILRTIAEMGFIIFLFYSNLLMGEYTRSGNSWSNGIVWAIRNIFTIHNFIIAIITSFVGHFFFGYLRRRCD